MRRRIITLFVSAAASTGLLASTATAAGPPEPRSGAGQVRILRGDFREPVLRPVRAKALAAAAHNAVIAKREARGQTTNPGPIDNETAPHTTPSG